MTYEYTKAVHVDKLTLEIKANADLKLKFTFIHTDAATVYIETNAALLEAEQTSLSAIITAHTNTPTTAQQVHSYLNNQVYPFVQNLIAAYASENIALGITQAGKTGHLLSMFTRYYPVPLSTHTNTLKAAFDTGSLYIARDILQYIRDNPLEYDGLSPFVTDARLLGLKNKVEEFLGIPLTL